MNQKIVIIGAGAAGLLCARKLSACGLSPLVFDKGGNPGGRLSTRRIDGGFFSHGARSFPDFKNFKGISDFAFDFFHQLETDNKIVFKNGVFQPTNCVSDFVRSLMQEIKVRSGFELKNIDIENKKLVLEDRNMNVITHSYEFLILAIPVSQTIKLLEGHIPKMETILAPSCMSLSVTGMYAFAKGQINWKKKFFENEKINAVLENSSFKSANKLDCWTVHSKESYAVSFEKKNKIQISEVLLTDFINLTDLKTPEPVYKAGHRWQFGFTKKPFGRPYIILEEHALGICGDWCLGPTVLHAANSGIKLAERLIDQNILL